MEEKTRALSLFLLILSCCSLHDAKKRKSISVLVADHVNVNHGLLIRAQWTKGKKTENIWLDQCQEEAEQKSLNLSFKFTKCSCFLSVTSDYLMWSKVSQQ